MADIRLGHTVLLGGRTWLKPVVEKVKWLNLETHTIPVRVEDGLTKSGVRLTVDVIAQVKIRSDPHGLVAASEQLAEKDDGEVIAIAKANLEGHIRGAVATLEVETINNDRSKLAARIQEEAVPDLAKLGLEITTFSVKDIADKTGYLDALGEKRTAEVLRDAAIGRAEAERDAQIAIAEAKKRQESAQAEALERDLRIARINAQRDGMTQEAERQAEIAEAEKDRDVRMQDAIAETQKAKASADVSYSVQKAHAEQALAREEQALAAAQADAERERQRMSTVVPAEAKADAVAAEAEGRKQEALRQAEAESAAIRLKGQAQAEAILAAGEAEAKALELRALAYEKFNDAAITDRIVSMLPQMMAEFAPAFQNTEKVIIIENGGEGGNSFASWVNKAMLTMPELVKGLTGKDLTTIIGQVSAAIKAGDLPPLPVAQEQVDTLGLTGSGPTPDKPRSRKKQGE